MADEHTPGLQLHPRTMMVQAAEIEIGMAISEVMRKHDLSWIEAMQGVTRWMLDSPLKYMLRRERHPAEPDKKADEA